ncbi:MAG: hypothetical protein SFU85_11760 [Candidatus Methylacidiphilales bacterium]|nr:hypothetical protein [Candidatus Methylacidiphilales bacterium]
MSEDSPSSRKEAAARILASPKNFKVCECCGSIVVQKAAVCPNCNAYRFDPQTTVVVRQAELLASRDPLSIDKMDYQ